MCQFLLAGIEVTFKRQRNTSSLLEFQTLRHLTMNDLSDRLELSLIEDRKSRWNAKC
jgi:hypothetical protein